MIAFLIAGIIAGGILLEIWSVKYASRFVELSYETDVSLTEPGAAVILTYTVSNRGLLPIFFAGCTLFFAEGIVLLESDAWKADYAEEGYKTLKVSHRFVLGPHKAFTRKLRFAFTGRGIHVMGRFYAELGDWLGLKSNTISVDMNKPVVCTAKRDESVPDLNTFGGILGDRSVRRFIHEDPNLIMGFHDYTGREPMKQISWFQTAKSGRLMVKQNDFTVDTNAAVVLNLFHKDVAVQENCLELCRTVAEKLEDQNVAYALYCAGDIGDIPEGLGHSHLYGLLKRIGMSRPACFHDLPWLVRRIINENGESHSYIVITPQPEPADEAALRKLQARSEQKILLLIAERKEEA